MAPYDVITHQNKTDPDAFPAAWKTPEVPIPSLSLFLLCLSIFHQPNSIHTVTNYLEPSPLKILLFLRVF